MECFVSNCEWSSPMRQRAEHGSEHGLPKAPPATEVIPSRARAPVTLRVRSPGRPTPSLPARAGFPPLSAGNPSRQAVHSVAAQTKASATTLTAITGPQRIFVADMVGGDRSAATARKSEVAIIVESVMVARKWDGRRARPNRRIELSQFDRAQMMIFQLTCAHIIGLSINQSGRLGSRWRPKRYYPVEIQSEVRLGENAFPKRSERSLPPSSRRPGLLALDAMSGRAVVQYRQGKLLDRRLVSRRAPLSYQRACPYAKITLPLRSGRAFGSQRGVKVSQLMDRVNRERQRAVTDHRPKLLPHR